MTTLQHETKDRAKSVNRPKSGLVAALDVGTTKVCCLIARPSVERGTYGDTGPRIVGIGHHEARGLRRGTVVDLAEAEAAIRAAVETAEQMAGENISDVVVNLSGGKPRSRLLAYEVSIGGHEVGDSDLRRVLESGANMAEQSRDGEREVLHRIPVGYTVDGNRGVHDPRGMFGQRLGVNVHLIDAQAGPLRNLRTAVERCHLTVADIIVTPYASARGGLVDDEVQLGVTTIDMGGGTTSVAVFFDGEIVHTEVIPVGGIHVTNDIARGLSTSLQHAERMKTLYGSCLPSASDDQEIIQVPLVGEDADDGVVPVPRSMLVGIIQPRIEETLELVRQRLEAAGFDKVAGRRVVLTGGACQLNGMAEFANRVLDKQVRIGRPRPVDGLAEAVAGPAFSTVTGLLLQACEGPAPQVQAIYRPAERSGGRLERLGQWLRENF